MFELILFLKVWLNTISVIILLSLPLSVVMTIVIFLIACVLSYAFANKLLQLRVLFLTEKVSLGQAFFRVLRFSPIIVIPPVFHRYI